MQETSKTLAIISAGVFLLSFGVYIWLGTQFEVHILTNLAVFTLLVLSLLSTVITIGIWVYAKNRENSTQEQGFLAGLEDKK